MFYLVFEKISNQSPAPQRGAANLRYAEHTHHITRDRRPRETIHPMIPHAPCGVASFSFWKCWNMKQDSNGRDYRHYNQCHS